RGRPVLFDLDIARKRSSPPPGPGGGTGPYMAPEQCCGEKLTPATDVFGLGVTLYRALTGAQPFPVARGRNRYPQLKTEAAPLRQYLANAPADLELLLQRCLSKEPSERPRLQTLLPALEQFIDEGPRMWPNGFSPLHGAD